MKWQEHSVTHFAPYFLADFPTVARRFRRARRPRRQGGRALRHRGEFAAGLGRGGHPFRARLEQRAHLRPRFGLGAQRGGGEKPDEPGGDRSLGTPVRRRRGRRRGARQAARAVNGPPALRSAQPELRVSFPPVKAARYAASGLRAERQASRAMPVKT
jgi:hypothetical protein